jgi:hypothetical protein
MDKQERCDLAHFATLLAFAAASMKDGSDDMTPFEMLDQVQQEHLLKLQATLCRRLDLVPADFSVDPNNVFTCY